MAATLNILSLWFPWLNFYSENIILQLLWFISFLLFISANTLYYSASYMLLIIIINGVFLAYYNLEVLTGFLLVVELTVFFIIILFLLALNFDGKLSNKIEKIIYYCFSLIFIYLFFFYSFSKPVSLEFLNANYYLDNYYHDINDDIMNDLFGLYLSYYDFNGVLFFIFSLLIFITSISTINLFKIIKIKTQEHLLTFQYIFDFFKDLLMFNFLRKQNMGRQVRRKASTRFVHTKRKNATKK